MKYIGLISSDARGKVGGQVATRSRAGTVLRSNAKPVRVNSAAQLTHRQWVAYISALWRRFSPQVKNGWASLAQQVTWTDSLGQPYHPTGFNLFRSINLARVMYAGNALAELPVSVPTVAAPTSASVLTNSYGGTLSELLLLFEPLHFPAGTYFRVDATPALSTGTVNPPMKRMRVIFARAITLSSPANLLTYYTAVFGYPPAHGKMFLSVRTCNLAYGWYSPALLISSTW